MKSISIMASGPPKPGRNRHLEKFNGKILISIVIAACTHPNTPVYLIVAKENQALIDYVQKMHPEVHIRSPSSLKMLDSFRTGLFQDENDTLIVAGDLWSLKRQEVGQFLNSKYSCALYALQHPWGKDLVSVDKKLIRRGDVGDSLVLIANSAKKGYLSAENIAQARTYFARFYPHAKFNPNKGNHLWTWIDYVFFHQITSSRTKEMEVPELNQGCIYFTSKLYLDND